MKATGAEIMEFAANGWPKDAEWGDYDPSLADGDIIELVMNRLHNPGLADGDIIEPVHHKLYDLDMFGCIYSHGVDDGFLEGGALFADAFGAWKVSLTHDTMVVKVPKGYVEEFTAFCSDNGVEVVE